MKEFIPADLQDLKTNDKFLSFSQFSLEKRQDFAKGNLNCGKKGGNKDLLSREKRIIFLFKTDGSVPAVS